MIPEEGKEEGDKLLLILLQIVIQIPSSHVRVHSGCNYPQGTNRPIELL